MEARYHHSQILTGQSPTWIAGIRVVNEKLAGRAKVTAIRAACQLFVDPHQRFRGGRTSPQTPCQHSKRDLSIPPTVEFVCELSAEGVMQLEETVVSEGKASGVVDERLCVGDRNRGGIGRTPEVNQSSKNFGLGKLLPGVDVFG